MGWDKNFDNRVPLKFCGGKPSYDKKSAQTAANSRFEQDHVKLRIYNCPKCNGWHLTKQSYNPNFDE